MPTGKPIVIIKSFPAMLSSLAFNCFWSVNRGGGGKEGIAIELPGLLHPSLLQATILIT